MCNPTLMLLVAVGSMLTVAGCTSFDSNDLKPKRTELLPVALTSITHPCSRTGPPPIESYWKPSGEQIEEMESHFDRLLRLKSTGCCLPGVRIESLAYDDLEYVGVVSGSRHLILIATSGDWCDGGLGAWGAVYDPSTGRFTDLHVNGIG